MGMVIKILQIAFTIALLLPQSAGANEMIGNKARGYVGGNIIQEAGENATNIIEVGSISGASVKNSSVEGHVSGNIIIRNSSGSVTLSIGSIRGKK